MAAKGLYKIAYRPKQAPDKSKPWCIYNIETGDINGRWHASKSDANDQLKAMYARMGDKALKMNTERLYSINLKEFAESGGLTWIDGDQLWVQQYPFDSWTHPIFSDTKIDVETANRLKRSFDDKIRNGKYFSDYEHGLDRARGGAASGEILELKVVEQPEGNFTQPGLWARVKFTDKAKQEIENGEWNYWSASHYDTWTHPQTGEQHEMVYDGGTLTNKPYVKGMVPLNFSELGVSEAEAAANAVAVEEPDVDENEDENEGGETVDEPTLEQELRQLLNLGDDANIVEHVKGMNDELTPLRDALKQHNERKAFAEAFPEEYERLQRLEAESQDNSAKRFSESYVDSRFTQKNGDEDVATTMGLSALSLDKVRGFAKQFSERTANLDGFKEVLDTIMGAGGIVDYGTKGSSREEENEHKEFNEQAAANATPQEVRKVFFDKVNEIAEKDELEFLAALEVATKTYPTLASAYRNAQPVK